MKVDVYNLEKQVIDNVELREEIFAVGFLPDVLQRIVEWQRSRSRLGSRKTKTISEVSGTTKKPHPQKGTGRARQGSLRSVHMRGGAVSFGPVVRSHEYSLNKKFRKLGLKSALSTRYLDGSLFIIDHIDLPEPKTKLLQNMVESFAYKTYLIIDGDQVNENFKRASANLFYVNGLPSIGANVLDLLKAECILITKEGLKNLEKRLCDE